MRFTIDGDPKEIAVFTMILIEKLEEEHISFSLNNEDAHTSEEGQSNTTSDGPAALRVNRKHSIIDDLSEDLRQKVEDMIHTRNTRYSEIQAFLQSQGINISHASIYRYAKRLLN